MNSSLFYRDLGQAIRKAREKSGQTQLELAEKAGLSRTSLTNIELGRQRLLVDQLSTIAACLNVALENLLPTRETIVSNEGHSGHDTLLLVTKFIESIQSGYEKPQ